MKTETSELVTFGNIVRKPVDEITPLDAIQAADAAHRQIEQIEAGIKGRPWPSIVARLEREKKALAAFIARFDSLVANSEYAKGDGLCNDVLDKF